MLENIKTKTVTKEMLRTIINDSYDSDLDLQSNYYYNGSISYKYILNALYELYKENDNTLIGEQNTVLPFTTEFIDQLRDDIALCAYDSLEFNYNDFEDMAALLEAESKPDYVAPLSIFHLEKGLRETYEKYNGDFEAYEVEHLSDYEDEMIRELYNTEYVSMHSRSYGAVLLFGTIEDKDMPRKMTRIISFNSDYTLLETGGNDTDLLNFDIDLGAALLEFKDCKFENAVIEFFKKNTTRIDYNTESKFRSTEFNYYIIEKTNLF